MGPGQPGVHGAPAGGPAPRCTSAGWSSSPRPAGGRRSRLPPPPPPGRPACRGRRCPAREHLRVDPPPTRIPLGGPHLQHGARRCARPVGSPRGHLDGLALPPVPRPLADGPGRTPRPRWGTQAPVLAPTQEARASSGAGSCSRRGGAGAASPRWAGAGPRPRPRTAPSSSPASARSSMRSARRMSSRRWPRTRFTSSSSSPWAIQRKPSVRVLRWRRSLSIPAARARATPRSKVVCLERWSCSGRSGSRRVRRAGLAVPRRWLPPS